jgi:chitinase
MTVNYPAGTKVLFNNLPYQAKWDSEGDSPAAEALDPAASAWLPLFTIPGEPTGSS